MIAYQLSANTCLYGDVHFQGQEYYINFVRCKEHGKLSVVLSSVINMDVTSSVFTVSRKTDKIFNRNTALPRMRHKSKLVVLVAVLFAFFLVFVCSQIWTRFRTSNDSDRQFFPAKQDDFETIFVQKTQPSPQKTNQKCRMFSCFNIYRCKYNENSLISVYVYPYTEFIEKTGDKLTLNPISQQYYELMSAIRQSSYYTDDRDNACVVIPPIDTLNQNGLDLGTVSRALASLPTWVSIMWWTVEQRIYSSIDQINPYWAVCNLVDIFIYPLYNYIIAVSMDMRSKFVS